MARYVQPYVWKQAPFVRLLPALAGGIVLQHYLPLSLKTILICLSVAILFLFYFSLENIARRFVHLQWRGILFLLLILFSGMLIRYTSDIQQKDNWYGHFLQKAKAFEAQIISVPEEKEKTYKLTAEIKKVILPDSVFTSIGKTILYIRKKDLEKLPEEGDVMIFKNKVGEIGNPKNPGSFDYKNYLSNKGIFHQVILSPNEWIITGNRSAGLDKLFTKTLVYENQLFSKNISSEGSRSLMKALITGDRKDIDKNIVQAYANTGVVHVLSISGLHIGLIYLFLIKLGNLLPGIRKKKLPQFFFVLSGVWFFAVLTGSGPSVLRSALMFSFLSLGIIQNKKVVTYNFWAASAFLILCFNPLLLWDIGFQLSYAAVLGILIWQKPIYSKLLFGNKLLDYTWQLISVSLSAQILTLPISLFYFHQFPLLFIIANLVAIPLVSLGLWAGMLLLFFGWISFIGQILGMFINRIFLILDSFILYIDSIRYGLWTGFYPSVAEVILLYLLIIFLYSWGKTKEVLPLKLALFSTLILCSAYTYSRWQKCNQDALLVYNVSGQSKIEYYNGFNFHDLNTVDEDESVIIKTGRSFFNVSNQRALTFFQSTAGEFYGGQRNFLLIHSKPEFKISQKKIYLDAIIISNSADVRIHKLNQQFETPLYIFTQDNNIAKVQNWKKECEELHLRAQDSRSQPALVFNY